MPTFGRLPSVDLAAGTTLLDPPGNGEGHWVGAPCVHDHGSTTYLGVRFRTPGERGHMVRIYALSSNESPGYEQDDLDCRAELTAEALGVVSLERPALVTDPRTGRLRCYLPVEHGENDWSIQRLAGVDQACDLDPTTARPALAPRQGTTDAETVKDPYIVTVGRRYYLFYAGHDGTSEQAHLATSVDGDEWRRVAGNPVLGRGHWHDHHTRVSAVVPAHDAPVWHVFYDGSGVDDHGNTWNLRTGTALSRDLESVVEASPDGPWLEAPLEGESRVEGEASQTGADRFRTCRYLDVRRRDNRWEVFAEVARGDGSFVLRYVTARFGTSP